MRDKFFQLLLTAAIIFTQQGNLKAQEALKLSLTSCREMALSQSESCSRPNTNISSRVLINK